jgi:hypothetical protein
VLSRLSSSLSRRSRSRVRVFESRKLALTCIHDTIACGLKGKDGRKEPERRLSLRRLANRTQLFFGEILSRKVFQVKTFNSCCYAG